MLFNWLAGAIRTVEGAPVDAETFEDAYYEKYKDKLESAEDQLGWPAEQQATAYGEYQILGENLARHHEMKPVHLQLFLSSPTMQHQVARKQFYIMLHQLVKRRGLAWPGYILSMWNAGIHHNERYAQAITAALKGGRNA